MNLLGAIFSFIASLLAISGSLFIFRSYYRSKNKSLIFLSLVFLMFGLHGLTLSTPSFFNDTDLTLRAYLLSLSMVFIFVAFVIGLRIPIFTTNDFIRKNLTPFSFLLSVIGLTIVAIQLIDFRLPIVNDQGFIFWNINPIAAWLAGGVALIYGFTWSYLLYKNSKLITNEHYKLKMQILMIDGILLGLAGLLSFTSTYRFVTLAGVALFMLAGLITVFIPFLPKGEDTEQSK
jgi:hypothetical protein